MRDRVALDASNIRMPQGKIALHMSIFKLLPLILHWPGYRVCPPTSPVTYKSSVKHPQQQLIRLAGNNENVTMNFMFLWLMIWKSLKNDFMTYDLAIIKTWFYDLWSGNHKNLILWLMIWQSLKHDFMTYDLEIIKTWFYDLLSGNPKNIILWLMIWKS